MLATMLVRSLFPTCLSLNQRITTFSGMGRNKKGRKALFCWLLIIPLMSVNKPKGTQTMAIITTPGAGVSPYQSSDTDPTVLRAAADGTTVLANATTADATGPNTSVYVAGQAAVNSLITSGQSGVFQGANVNITLEEQNFNTTNQVTSTINYASGAAGSIQYNNGANGFAGSDYFTYTSGNVVTPGIRTDGYFYSNGAPFTSGGNAAIGNFVFNGDNMTIAHANSTLSVTGNGTGNVNISANGNTWTFGNNSNLTFPDNSGASWPINQQRFGMGNIGAWLDGQWTIGEFSGNGVSGTVGIRIDPAIEGNTGVTIPNQVDSTTQPVQIYNTGGGGISLYTGANNWAFNADGTTTFPTLTVDLHNGGTQTGQTLQLGDPNQQAFITGPAPAANVAAQRLIIQGQRGLGTGEGGDVYVWGGDSEINGGDIKIYAGDADNGSSGQGGNVHIAGGSGQNIGGEISLIGGITYNGQGAPVVVAGGRGSTTGGNVSLNGGYGDLTGGSIDISGGLAGNGLGSYGNVNINAGASSWHFENTGNLTLPSNIASINYANGQPYGGTGTANTGNVTFNDINVIGTGNLKLQPDANNAGAYLDIYLTTGPDIHIAGNGENVIVGGDSTANVTVNTLGNVSIQTWNGAANIWDFGVNGNLTVPGDMVINGNTNIFGTDTALIQPTDNIPLAFVTSGANAGTTSIWVSNISDPGNSSIAGMYAPLPGTGNVRIVTGNNAGTVNFWDFTSDGNLTTPGVSGNITGANVISANTFTLSSGNLSIVNQIANSAYSGIQSADNIPIGLISSNTNGTITLGWRYNIANISQGYSGIAINPSDSTGNIVISGVEVGGTGNTSTWTFDPFPDGTGNMVFPTGMHITSDGAGGTRISQNSNVANVGLRISAGNTNAFTSIGWSLDEIPGIGPVAAIGFNSPVSPSNAQIITGNLSATQYRWTFDNSGNLTLPGSLVLSPNTIITGSGASPAPSINGFDTINAISFSASGNILSSGIVKTGVYVTGNIPTASIAGVGSRAFVTDADAVTFGNLYVGGAGNSMPVWSNGTNWYIG